MIIKVKFKDNETEEEFTMLFGDSYKSWQEQYKEFLRTGDYTPLRAWKSQARWKGWGGLKWCEEKDFQEELNREDVQHGEPNNPNARQYSLFQFEEFKLSKLPA